MQNHAITFSPEQLRTQHTAAASKDNMAGTSMQFAIATHMMTALGFHYGEEVTSSALAQSVNANPTFIRKSLSKLAKAGLVVATRGKTGFCTLARPPQKITLKDIYLASEAPATFAIHTYPVEKTCPISSNIKGCMSAVQHVIQQEVEDSLSKITLSSLVSDVKRRSARAAVTQRSRKRVGS